MSDDAETLAEVLAAHEGWDGLGRGIIECEGCGWRSEQLGPEWNGRKSDRHRQHVAEALAAHIVQARAGEGALREAAWDEALRWVRQQAEVTSPEYVLERIDRAEPFNPYRAALTDTAGDPT